MAGFVVRTVFGVMARASTVSAFSTAVTAAGLEKTSSRSPMISKTTE
jgi:hypothetical protein